MKPAAFPKYRKPLGALPPAKFQRHRLLVSHPPAPTSSSTPSSSTAGAQFVFTTTPRAYLPLTVSTKNHRLWNPSYFNDGLVEEESDRMRRFRERFAAAPSQEQQQQQQQGTPKDAKKDTAEDKAAPAALDLSALEGETLQSSTRALGKKDIYSSTKSGKKK